MVKNKLEEDTKRLVALYFLTSTTGSFSDRAKRKFDKTKEEIGDILKAEDIKLSDGSGLTIKLKWSDEAAKKARKIELGIREFKQEYPKYGEKLQGLIDQHRKVRRAYLKFGGEITDGIYVKIIKEIMGTTNDSEAKALYESMNNIGVIFKKDKYKLQSSILSE